MLRHKNRPRALRLALNYRLPVLVLTIVWSVSRCLAQSPASAVVTAPPLHLSIPPGASSHVPFRTLPNAVCSLHLEGSSNPEETLKLYADSQGLVHFNAQPAADASAAAKLIADCQAGRTSLSHAIELQPVAGTKPLSAPMPEGAKIRPALAADPLLAADQELLARGYPPRPDPVQAPGAYAAWLHAVSKPSILIPPNVITAHDRFHGSRITAGILQQSTNWSGFELQGKQLYDIVTGSWTVPAVTGEINTALSLTRSNPPTNSVLWIGLDGDGSNDVVQDGTEQDATAVRVLNSVWSLTSYYAWTEWFPLPEQQIANFPVRPGDQIFSVVWVGDASGTASVTGSIGHYYLENITTSQSVQLTIPIPAGAVFVGLSAEWILERPSINGSLPSLADYGTAYMSGAYAHAQGGSIFYLPYTGATNAPITMINGANQRS